MRGTTVEIIEALDRGWQEGAPLVAGLTPEQLAAPTPCTGWDVRALLTHMVVANGMFTRVNLGQPPHVDGEDDVGFDRLASTWADMGRANVESWRRTGLTGERTYPFGTFPAELSAILNVGEVLIHGWDLARATGQEATLDPDLVSLVYEMYLSYPLDQYRAYGAFGPEVPVPADSPAADRLLGLLGRAPLP